MGAFSYDDNFRETRLREGPPLGGYLKLNATDFPVDTWHRLMPSGDAGAIVANTVDHFGEKLNIGTLRDDIENTDVSGWLLKVLNPGYQQKYIIGRYDGGIVHLGSLTPGGNSELALHLIQGDVEFVIYPVPINPFHINYFRDAIDDIEIGWQLKDVLTPTNVISLGELRPGERMKIPIQSIGNLMFKIGAYTTNAKNHISWGEQSIHGLSYS